MAYTLPSLPYDYGALEPYIDAQTMEIHHGKHHAAYISNLEKALEAFPGVDNQPIEIVLQDLHLMPEPTRTAVRNNGGGHYNHSLFWKMMKKDGGGRPVGAVEAEIKKHFGSFDAFQDSFNSAAKGVFGSGWAWLVVDQDGKLLVISTPNQDSPIIVGKQPILGLDVWEHAYYLKYQNRRPSYIEAWWHVVNWAQVEENYRAVMR